MLPGQLRSGIPEWMSTYRSVARACTRCKKNPPAIMSMFNRDMICNECKNKERDHPMYGLAEQLHNEEVESGNLNFAGIGLPEDFKVDSV